MASGEIRKTIRRLYRGIDGYDIPRDEERLVKQSRCSPTYGELTLGAVGKLLDYLDMSEHDVFYDLGSGLGKVVLQTAIALPLKRCVGIELSASRCRNARSILLQARKLDLVLARRCVFRNEDFLTAELTDATVVYSCSTAFSRTIMRRLAKQLVAAERELIFVSLQDLASRRRISHVDTLHLDTTWDRRSTLYVYEIEKP